MKIIVNDYGSYAFPLDLSTELALQGHEVFHLRSAELNRGRFENVPVHQHNLHILPIAYHKKLQKESYKSRYDHEINYAGKFIDLAAEYRPDIVISANTPLFAQEKIQRYCRKNSIRFIFWCQDLISMAALHIFRKKLGMFSRLPYYLLNRKEIRILKGSDQIVTITEDFNTLLAGWGVDGRKITCIPNWAPINEIPLYDKHNEWTAAQGFTGSFNIVYTGTLGFKHDPDVLLQAAEKLALEDKDIRFIIISEGEVVEYLKQQVQARSIGNISILPFQDFNRLPLVLAAADVLISILEPEAGVFSVPSKVLTYLCAGRPIVLTASRKNLAAKIIEQYETGICVEPKNLVALVDAIRRLKKNPVQCTTMGANGRAYAAAHFPIAAIAERFTAVFGLAAPPVKQV